MINLYRIAKKDIDTLLDDFAKYASKDCDRYKRVRYEKWKRLKNADSWEIRFSDDGVHEDSLYSTLLNGITVRVIKGNPADEEFQYELFGFQAEDGSFGSFLEDKRMEGVLVLMSSMFDKNIFTDVSISSATVSDQTTTSSTINSDWSNLCAKTDYIVADITSPVNTTKTSDSINVSAITIDTNHGDIGCTIAAPCWREENRITSWPTGSIASNGDVILNGKINFHEDKGDKKTMNTGIKFNFGTCEKDNIKLSMYGIAIKNAANEWVAYDSKTGNLMNVDIFNFDGGKYLFKMPVAIKDIKVGDTVVHNGTPMYVKGLSEGSYYPIVVDPKAGEEKVILPTKNMFGFDFATKVVSLFDMGSAAAPSKDSPFGNMWPLLLADGNTDPLVLMMMSNGMKDMNPMMMYALMSKDKGNNDMGLLMAMSMMGQK